MKKTILTLTAVIALSTVNAQQISDVLRFSKQNYSLGSARTAAMGGAFTSLGADLYSTSINPAGLGMYIGSEFGVSASMMFGKQNSNYLNSDLGINKRSTETRDRFALSNIGIALNTYKGGGNLTSVSWGFSYNKLADFNSRLLVRGANDVSLSDVWRLDLNGIKQSELSGSGSNPYKAFNNFGIGQWGAILGYQSQFVNPIPPKEGEEGDVYDSSISLADGMMLGQTYTDYTQGYLGEYAISSAINISNKLYLGLTIGVQTLSYGSEKRYTEDAPDNTLELIRMRYRQVLSMTGTGVNAKFGFILRPIDSWRIGMSVQTPTSLTIKESYREYMSTNFKNGYESDIDSPTSPAQYHMITPTRLNVGTSLTIAGMAIISADYERVWYNKMSIRDNDLPDLKYDIEDEIAQIGIKASNNVRVGAEVMPIPKMFIRAGYAYYGTMYGNTDNGGINTKKDGSTNSFSAGLGYRDGLFNIDFAYVYQSGHDSGFMYGNQSALGTYTSKMIKNFATLSFGVKF